MQPAVSMAVNTLGLWNMAKTFPPSGAGPVPAAFTEPPDSTNGSVSLLSTAP
jgi:hypothetical protein